jgi:hypothetical protein
VTDPTTNMIEKESTVSNSSLGTNLSPFFDHLETDRALYLQLNNSIDLYDADFFHHAFTNDPVFTISNATQFATDLIYFLMGFGGSITDLDQVDYTGTPLWDDLKGGFYAEMDGTLTTVSDTKKVFDNLLYILALLEGADSVSNQAALTSKITSQWNNVVNDFWDNQNGAFNHSNANINERYSTDNFLGAIVAFSIGKSFMFTEQFRTTAIGYGNDIMEAFNTSMYDGLTGQEGFYNTSNILNAKIGTNNKNLLTNALGIYALLEWSMHNDYEVVQAEKIWNFLNSRLVNGPNNLYIAEASRDGYISIDSNMYLLQNAWMLKTSLELFKHTGNSTYYEGAFNLFNGIEQNLYDSTNGGYNSLVGSSEKTMDGYGMLINALNDFYKIFTESEIIVDFNQTEFIYQKDPTLNLLLAYNITMDFSYPVIGKYWNISAPIVSADIQYVLRYANNGSIVNIVTSTTNSTGQDELLYDLSTLTSFYQYTLDIRCNRTGYNVGVRTIDFPLTAGFEIVDVVHLYDTLHQDDTVKLNITYISSRPDNINATTITSGENFQTEVSNRHIITREDEIDGKVESSIIVNVKALENAQLGSQILNITVLNDDLEPILLDQIQLEIYSAVEVTSVFVNEYMIDFNPTDILFTFQNHRSSQNESVIIGINGSAFKISNTTFEGITPLSQKTATVRLEANENAKMGILDFTVTIWRNDTVIFSDVFSIQAVPEIEILEIYSDGLQVIQGQTPTVTVRLRNYNTTSQQIYIDSNGVQVLDRLVSFGESHFRVELGKPIRNPYNIGKEVYEVKIYDESKLNPPIATKVVTVDIKPSTLNIFLFYVLPLLIPVGVIVYFKYKELEQIKRTK